ncbi:MAG: hypothetical protein ABJ379_06490 [Roseibium sp.]|uniref:hypothetical protein n=1 Tax=Roseibium sp. TaxID=1936156 RepID=UPI0032969C2A
MTEKQTRSELTREQLHAMARRILKQGSETPAGALHAAFGGSGATGWNDEVEPSDPPSAPPPLDNAGANDV